LCGLQSKYRAPHRVRDIATAHGADFAGRIAKLQNGAVLWPPASRNALNHKLCAMRFEPGENRARR
jgi:hypothetical protein